MKSAPVFPIAYRSLPFPSSATVGLFLFQLFICLPSMNAALIDFTNRQSLDERAPIIIAHRGGVVTEHAAECSVSALDLAAEQGYDMVELDVQMSSDLIPIVFHDRTLGKACGRKGRVQDYPAAELETFRYQKGGDTIIRLSTALERCRQKHLGVMLDLKSGRDSEEFLRVINRMIAAQGLASASISFSGSDTAREVLTHVRFTPTEDELKTLKTGEKISLQNRFWFGLPNQLDQEMISRLKASGALILPAINTFRYPARNHRELAHQDITWLLAAGVDGFQIDSIYFDLFPNQADDRRPSHPLPIEK